MKKMLVTLFLISSIGSVSVIASDSASEIPEAETRIVSLDAEATEEITETKYSAENSFTDENGFSLWYNAESVKPSEYGGQLCFIPEADEDALKSQAVLIVVPNKAGETPSPLNEVTAAYPAENVSEIEEITTESGITIQTVQAEDNGQLFEFYIVSFEEYSLNITSMILDEEYETYQKDFDRIIETISFES